MDVTDSEMMGRIAARDQAAFAAFYDQHASRVHGLVVRIMGVGRDAEDVLQEIFWQVWSQAGRFNAERGGVSSWLTSMARSRALDQLRRRARHAADEGPADRPGGGEDVAGEVSRSEEAQRTRQALENLPLEQKSAIQMAFYGGYTYEEIARRENLPLGTVKTRIRLGMRKLREALIEPEVAAT